MRIFELPAREGLLSGHSACPGCAVALAIRHVLKALDARAVIVVPPSCIAGAIVGVYPRVSFDCTVFQCALPATAATAVGISRGLHAQGIVDVPVVALAGDGGTYDIGMQCLSGAAERNEDILYICMNNEGYMNTGAQKSGATPRGAATTTLPAGKPNFKKPMMDIMAAHRIPYAATATPAFPADLVRKVQRAQTIRGTRYVDVLCPCIRGWGIDDDEVVKLGRLAVESRVLPLYEVFDGTRYVVNHRPRGIAVGEYLRAQRRFSLLSDADVEYIQRAVDREWSALIDRAEPAGQGQAG